MTDVLWWALLFCLMGVLLGIILLVVVLGLKPKKHKKDIPTYTEPSEKLEESKKTVETPPTPPVQQTVVTPAPSATLVQPALPLSKGWGMGWFGRFISRLLIVAVLVVAGLYILAYFGALSESLLNSIPWFGNTELAEQPARPEGDSITPPSSRPSITEEFSRGLAWVQSSQELLLSLLMVVVFAAGLIGLILLIFYTGNPILVAIAILLPLLYFWGADLVENLPRKNQGTSFEGQKLIAPSMAWSEIIHVPYLWCFSWTPVTDARSLRKQYYNPEKKTWLEGFEPYPASAHRFMSVGATPTEIQYSLYKGSANGC